MALYVFEVQHGCTHLETVRHDLDEETIFDPVRGWVGADREDMKVIKELAVAPLCPDCQWAQDAGYTPAPPPDIEEDLMRVPDLLTRRWREPAAP